MNTKTCCTKCGGELKFQYCDGKRIYSYCGACGWRAYYTFRNKEEAEQYMHKENREILTRVYSGLVDWEMAPWDLLHKEVVNFVSTHPYVTNDIRFQMARIACITRGFHIMDEDIYRCCQSRFIITEEVYKGLMEFSKEQLSLPRKLEDLKDYDKARENYMHLRTLYLADKATAAIIKTTVKTLVRPYLPIPSISMIPFLKF